MARTKATNTESTKTRSAAAKESAPINKATRSVREPAPAKPCIAMDAKASEVEKVITSIKTRGAKLDADIHSTAMACVFHADKHGDVTLMNRLLLAMPKSTRRNALAQWAVAFGKFQENPDKQASASLPLAFNKTGKTDLEGAQAKPFWDFRNVKEGTTEWVFTNFIEGVMKTLAAKAAGSSPEAAKCKAAFDALNGVKEAIAIAPNGGNKPFIEGETPERRGVGRAVPASMTAH